MHEHEEVERHELLQIQWCVCGWERRTDRKDAKWLKPRKTTGILRAAQWKGE